MEDKKVKVKLSILRHAVYAQNGVGKIGEAVHWAQTTSETRSRMCGTPSGDGRDLIYPSPPKEPAMDAANREGLTYDTLQCTTAL
jgi:hypothetical protein